MPEKADIYRGLRDQALQTTAQALKLPVEAGKTQAYGVVTDWALNNGTATIVAFATGDASLYLSGGGGVIGGASHEKVRLAARSVIAAAAKRVGALTPASAYPVPATGQTRFTVLTTAGNYSGEFATDALGAGKHVCSPVFFAVQELISQLRVAK